MGATNVDAIGVFERMVDAIGINNGAILDPCSGGSSIVELLIHSGAHASNIYCVKCDEKIADKMVERYHVKMEVCEFLDYNPADYGYDLRFARIFMNPPDGMEIEYITHAYGMLARPGSMAVWLGVGVADDYLAGDGDMLVALTEMANKSIGNVVIEVEVNHNNSTIMYIHNK